VQIAAAAGLTAVVFFASPSLAGVLTDEARGIALTYDEADWKTQDGHWPLACTSPKCTALTCEPDTSAGGGGNIEDVLSDAKTSQDVALGVYDDAKRVARPKITEFGVTKGVYWSTKWRSEVGDGVTYEYSFKVLTKSGASWATIVCSGETTGAKKVDSLFEDLMSGMELR